MSVPSTRGPQKIPLSQITRGPHCASSAQNIQMPPCPKTLRSLAVLTSAFCLPRSLGAARPQRTPCRKAEHRVLEDCNPQ
jgi:hypothetical protein